MNTSLFTLPRPWPLAALAVFGGLSGIPAYAVTCTGGLQPTNPDSIYTVHGDGTVTDTRTGLMWKTCLEGQSGSDCDQGSVTAMDWAGALAAAQTANASPSFAGHTNWRLPNIKELQSLSEYCRAKPYDDSFDSTALNDSIFKNVPSTAPVVWSGTPVPSPYANYAYAVSLTDGGITPYQRNSTTNTAVRLVRDVQPAGPVNGACGSAHNPGTTPLLTSAPGSGLCSAGTASSVTGGTSTFTWNCTGSGTGSTSASCQAPRGYTVTPSAGANGSISPSTAQTVAYNARPSFTLSPASGYVVDAVAGTCGGNLTGSSYTTAAVTQNCTVTASFRSVPTYAVTASVHANVGGTASCSPNPATQGASATCTAMPALNYRFSAWTGACAGQTATCTLSNIQSAKASTAVFAYEVTVPQGPQSGQPVGITPPAANNWKITSASTATTASVSTAPPANVSLPHGIVNLQLAFGIPGSSATVVLTYPQAFPAGTKYYKFGKTAGNTTPHWYEFSGAVISGNTITLTLADGGAGDNDLQQNGMIDDPGGPALLAGAQAIPTLGEWALILLSGLLGLFGLGVLRRRA